MVSREGQIKHTHTTKLKGRENKQTNREQPINPGRKHIPSFSLLELPCFHPHSRQPTCFLSHLIPKAHFGVFRKNTKLNGSENLLTPSRNTTQETTFVLALIFLLLFFPIGIGMKSPKPKACVPCLGTTENGDQGSHILFLILVWREKPAGGLGGSVKRG